MTYRIYIPLKVSKDEAQKHLEKMGVKTGRFFRLITRETERGYFTCCRVTDRWRAYHLFPDYLKEEENEHTSW